MNEQKPKSKRHIWISLLVVLLMTVSMMFFVNMGLVHGPIDNLGDSNENSGKNPPGTDTRGNPEAAKIITILNIQYED